MLTKTKWEKEELLKVLNEQRAILRCDLLRKLNEKGEQLTKCISHNIKKCENNLTSLKTQKEAILEKNDLLNVTGCRYGCDVVSLNQELKTFDENTNIERKNILQG